MAKLTGKQLAKFHGIDVEQARYRKTGDWFHPLTEFPGVLFDEGGYIYFRSQEDYDAFLARGVGDGIKQNLDTDQLTIGGGISARDGYVSFEDDSLFPDELSGNATVIEGAKRRVTVNSYERDASARRTCIKKWGLNCAACDFNFTDMYGELGDGFIHVHHLMPLHSIKQEYALAPEQDLRPVCPNCHAMLHRREPPLSIDELRSIINKPKAGERVR